ncbi:hypothetical protein QBC47DRAFT_122466 [Echria macrotheca]|uniref:Fucose-specific lectin n=1 Tax=Echria macrotheca TaxID=438768 RepID=A0AAJ0B6F9_9PEZI|nr:hypothetical protein QBC47DRAFT_122466 [Echria macrotheca]
MAITMAPKVLLLLAAAVVPSQAAMSAWWTGIGPQVVFHNKTTGAIRYTACNSFGDAYYSYTGPNELKLNYKPKNDTPLAGVGYWNEKNTVSSIYYIEQGGSIANILLNCNMGTGLFETQGNWIISDSDVGVSNTTGLAALLLGETGGYRVYFNGANNTIDEMRYSPQSNQWSYTGIISQDPQGWGALAAVFSGTENITVASARDPRSIEIVRYNSDTNWRISTLPYTLQGNLTTQATLASNITINETAPVNFTLSAWEGTPSSLGMSIDSDYTRSVWYIGNDRELYQIVNKNYFWSPNSNQSTAFWPAADEPNAEFGTLWERKTSIVRHYYFVDSRLAEVRYEDGAWKAWTHLEPPPPPAATNSTSPGAQATTNADSNTGLSTGAKAGVGVGVALGVISLGVLGAAIFLIRRKKQKNAAAASELPAPGLDQSPVPPYGSPGPRPDSHGYDAYVWEKKDLPPQPPYPAQLDATGQPTEVDATGRPTELYVPQAMYELADQAYSHELVGDHAARPGVVVQPQQHVHQQGQ